MKIGDKVRIKPGTVYYGYPITSSNPKDTIGIIKYIYSSGTSCSVEWKNNRTNSYTLEDLELVVVKDNKPKSELEKLMDEMDKEDILGVDDPMFYPGKLPSYSTGMYMGTGGSMLTSNGIDNAFIGYFKPKLECELLYPREIPGPLFESKPVDCSRIK